MGTEICMVTDEQIKATKSLLKLYRTVLHNVNNELYYLDEVTYTTSRKHLMDLVGGLVEFEIQTDVRDFNNKVESCHKSLSLLELIDTAVSLVHDYPKTGKMYYEILFCYYMGLNDYTHDDLMDILCLSRAKYYRMHRKALECFYLHFMTVVKKHGFEFDHEKLLDEYA